MDFDTLRDELTSAVDAGLKHARTLDSSVEAEVYVSFNTKSTVDIDQGVVSAESGSIAGTAVRLAKDKRIGFASVSGYSLERVRKCVDEAFQVIVSTSVNDSRFRGFCDPSPHGNEGRFDTRIMEQSVEDLLHSCRVMVSEAAAADGRVKTVSASAESSWGGYAVGNTRGVMGSSRHVANLCSVSAQAIDGDERRGSMEFDVATDRLIQPEGLGTRVGKQAAALLGAKKLGTTARLPTVWTPIAAASYLVAGIGQATLGRHVVERTSPLCDRIGEQIADPSLTLLDDGQRPTGMGTNAVDAEGHGQRTNTVVERGVLKTFLFDNYWGAAFGVGSTGNCGRGGGVFPSRVPYEHSPTVGTKWLVVKPGTKTEQGLIESIDGQAILIMDFPLGIFHGNVSSGEFSAVANSVFLIEDGEIEYPIQPVSVAGNFHEGLRNIIGVADNARPIPFGCESPTIAFDGFSIVG
ncbi:MAG: TldD/PmbA family protein [Candidatus Thorarchaeota archaeon]|nr:TldD/PmbA family protein [Candidatus Thorarchaeota archaeon]